MGLVAPRASGLARRVAFGAALAVLAPAVAGCGGGPSHPSVASIGTTTSGAAASGSKPRSVGPALSPQQETAIDDAYAACMTAHGIPARAMADGAGVGFLVRPGTPGPGSPQFTAAQRACKRLLPKGGLPAATATQHAAITARMLKLSECMRAHGEPNFPDPTTQGLHIGPNSGIDPSSPQFQTAQHDCARYFPGGSPPTP